MTSALNRQKMRFGAFDRYDKARIDDEALLEAIIWRERGESWRAIGEWIGMKPDSLRGAIVRLWRDYAASEAA